MADPEITTVSPKGQVVIPQAIRRRLKLAPRSKLLVYGEGDTLIMKKIPLPDIMGEWEEIKRLMEEREKRCGAVSEEDIGKEIDAHRKAKKR